MARYSAEEVLDLLNEEDNFEDGLDEILCEGSDEEFQLEMILRVTEKVNVVMRMML